MHDVAFGGLITVHAEAVGLRCEVHFCRGVSWPLRILLSVRLKFDLLIGLGLEQFTLAKRRYHFGEGAVVSLQQMHRTSLLENKQKIDLTVVSIFELLLDVGDLLHIDFYFRQLKDEAARKSRVTILINV